MKVLRYAGTTFRRIAQVHKFEVQFKELARRGHTVCLVLAREPHDIGFLEPFLTLNVEIKYLPRPRSSFDILAMRRIWRLCRTWRPDILHCDNIHLVPLMGAAFANIPVRIWHKRSMSTAFERNEPLTIKSRISLSTRLSVFLSRKVICVSNAVSDELRSLGVNSQKKVVLNNPWDVMNMHDEESGAAFRNKYCIALTDIVGVTVGHAVPVKGWVDLIEAFVQVSHEHPNLKLIFAGSFKGNYEADTWCRIKAIVKKHRLDGRVIFTGAIDDVSLALQASNFFVLPSLSEGNSNALLEALVARKPCIATNVGAAPELISDGKTGVLVDRGRPDQLAQALAAMCDSDTRHRLTDAVCLPKWVPTREEYSKQLANLYEAEFNDLSSK